MNLSHVPAENHPGYRPSHLLEISRYGCKSVHYYLTEIKFIVGNNEHISFNLNGLSSGWKTSTSASA